MNRYGMVLKVRPEKFEEYTCAGRNFVEGMGHRHDDRTARRPHRWQGELAMTKRMVARSLGAVSVQLTVVVPTTDQKIAAISRRPVT